MKTIFLLALSITFSAFAFEAKPLESLNDKEELKSEIVRIAENFKGQGDPDLKIQNLLVPYVNKLIEINPQGTVQDRLNYLVGSWQQVWGPYDYRSDDRGVDLSIDPENIYQVIFQDGESNGYYYNVSNTRNKKTLESRGTSFLRGEFKVVDDTGLRVRFTSLKRIKTRPPEGLSYTDLPELVENNNLDKVKKVLPNWFVKLTFGGGILREVYTDESMRLAYGTDYDEFDVPYLYVMTRAE